ncbi:hypothetical protein ACFOVU_28290 [Nocardiopsis sediminis]|uniref:Uncharacterized protein n=1 Tax=Nocardiopsis sediminis TaxID=1778267 RepID=A0ABV8FUK2_9ACTN
MTIDSVAATVVAKIAPDEMAAYPQVLDEFFFTKGRAKRGGDNPLGFGSIAVGVITGFVLGVLHDLVVESIADSIRPWWNRAWRRIAELLRLRRRAAPGPDTEIRPLSSAEIPGIVAAITERAVRTGIPPEQAGDLAAAIVAELTRPGGPGDDD